MYNYKLEDIRALKIPIEKGNIVFLYGDLRAGKTTISKHIINNILLVKEEIRSPTYTYYNKYGDNIYHFDLYRLNSYDEFFAIGGEEILDNPNNICIIEWPEILEDYFKANIKIKLYKTENVDERIIEIT